MEARTVVCLAEPCREHKTSGTDFRRSSFLGTGLAQLMFLQLPQLPGPAGAFRTFTSRRGYRDVQLIYRRWCLVVIWGTGVLQVLSGELRLREVVPSAVLISNERQIIPLAGKGPGPAPRRTRVLSPARARQEQVGSQLRGRESEKVPVPTDAGWSESAALVR